MSFGFVGVDVDEAVVPVLPTAGRASTSGTIDSEFSFGVSSASDLKFEVVPQMEGSLSNGACSASISGLSKGTVTVRITDNNYSHSVGYHNLREDAFALDSLNFTNPSLAQIKSSSWIEATYTPRITLCEYPSILSFSHFCTKNS